MWYPHNLISESGFGGIVLTTLYFLYFTVCLFVHSFCVVPLRPSYGVLLY